MLRVEEFPSARSLIDYYNRSSNNLPEIMYIQVPVNKITTVFMYL